MACGTPLNVLHHAKNGTIISPSYLPTLYYNKYYARLVASSSRKKKFSKGTRFLEIYSNDPGVAKNWHVLKSTKKGPRICHNLMVSWVQIWQNIPMGNVPKCWFKIPKGYVIRWFKCKLKPPKNDAIVISELNEKGIKMSYISALLEF